ncbi:uncharacterized protein LOC119613317 [Lucilia sericata]|uniref:uncharacterized protein LOC119613317 n=1 Tax=Lucilia sericata TaxID=13632 RepID=UPI0018A80176|nr:uncharacterized protein LOC119613317 [Lucilia sericata]
MNMSGNNDSFSTPKQTKRLGLRRTSSILRDKKATGSIPKPKILEVATPVSTSSQSTPVSTSRRSRLPQSDVKINYKNLEHKCKSNNTPTAAVKTPGTPKNTSSSTVVQRLAVSTNCRPYRLALSKKVREKMTKKRLEFYLANEMDKNEATGNEKKEEEPNVEQMSKEDLLQQIEIARKELKARQDHKKKVQDLQQAINVWKTGFSSALLDLQHKIEPRLETATLLERLHIPQEMLKYINDE